MARRVNSDVTLQEAIDLTDDALELVSDRQSVDVTLLVFRLSSVFRNCVNVMIACVGNIAESIGELAGVSTTFSNGKQLKQFVFRAGQAR